MRLRTLLPFVLVPFVLVPFVLLSLACSSEAAPHDQGNVPDGGAPLGDGSALDSGADGSASMDGATTVPNADGSVGTDAMTALPDSSTDAMTQWEPLTTSTVPTCTHAPAPDGFTPVLVGTFSADSEQELAVLGSDSDYLILRCDEHLWALHPTTSPDRRKVLFVSDTGSHTTSWLLDGVFALPAEIDGLTTSTYFWINDEYLLTRATRTDALGAEVLERALMVVSWDGSVTMRLAGEIRLEGYEDTSDEFIGANDSFGVYRLDAAEGGGYEYYRVDFAERSSTLIASGIGANYPISNPFDPDTGRLLIVGNGEGIDYLYDLEVESGTLIELESAAQARAELSPDGQYAVWRITDAFQSQPMRAGSEPFTYEILYHTSLLAFDPTGHRFAATTDDKELVVVDPETGEVSAVLHEAVEEAAQGVIAIAFAPDGAGVFFVAALTVDAVPSLYYTPLTGPAQLLHTPESETPFGTGRLSPDGQHSVFADHEALVVASRDGTVQSLPGPPGAQGSAISWSSDSTRVLIRGALSIGQHISLSPIDGQEAPNLLDGVDFGLGGPITGLVDYTALLR